MQLNMKEIADNTASCIIESMHVHASGRKLTEAGSV